MTSSTVVRAATCRIVETDWNLLFAIPHGLLMSCIAPHLKCMFLDDLWTNQYVHVLVRDHFIMYVSLAWGPETRSIPGAYITESPDLTNQRSKAI